MIQRIQSIYLLIAAIPYVVFLLVKSLWENKLNLLGEHTETSMISVFSALIILTLITIFLYKNRNTQLKLIGLNLFLNVLLIGYLTYNLLKLPGGFAPEKGIGLALPFISIVFLISANRSIKKDEELVKSVDRFR